MRICANLPLPGRDLGLDLFRGLANWAIFLDHIPHEVLSWITIGNYGFSDAADLLVLISGHTAAAIELSLNSLWVQISVGLIGVVRMTAIAYYRARLREHDRIPPSLSRAGGFA